MVFTFLSFVVVVGIIIFVHELGHFLAAKAVGIRVIRFSLGFPPKLIGKTVGDTEYCICWIPLGGYVKMAGMLDESFEDEDAISGEPWEFESKNALQKAFVICAGVVMNFILGMVIFSMIAGISGIPEAKDPMIGEVVPGYPAEQAGLQAGDLVTEVNGVPVSSWSEIVAQIHNLTGEKSLTMQLEREGDFDLSATCYFQDIGRFGFVSGASTHQNRMETIRRVYDECGVIIDTHTADGVKVGLEQREPGIPLVCLETALPAKFEASIQEALGRGPDRPSGYENIEHEPQHFVVMDQDVEAVKKYIAQHGIA